MIFNNKNNILVTGAKGQLGSYLVRELSKIAFKKKSCIGQVFGIDIDDLDLTHAIDVADFFNTAVIDPHVKIHYVIHCAAATDTAAIEKDPLKYYASTVIGTRNVAESCAYNGIKMIHISTDYVMSELSPDGLHGNKIEFPVNQYGMHKLLAEKEAQVAYFKAGHPEKLLIGRLSWLFGNSHNSFVEKLLRGICKTYAKAVKCGESEAVHKVVDDAFGRPTPVSLVLSKILNAIEDKSYGEEDFQYFHPQITRLDWATMIWEEFCSECNNHDIKPSILCGMMNAVRLSGVKSDDLDLGMRHPGLVDTRFDHDMPCESSEYLYCTSLYVHENFDFIVNEVMLKTLENEGVMS